MGTIKRPSDVISSDGLRNLLGDKKSVRVSDGENSTLAKKMVLPLDYELNTDCDAFEVLKTKFFCC
jgi:hypothetical protein